MTERRRGIPLPRQARLLAPLAVAWLVSLLVLAALGIQRSIPLEQLFLDPATVAGAPWYSGVMSSIGILGWTVAVVAGAGGAWVAHQTERPTAAEFLGAGAIASAMLLADDLLLLHSNVIPQVTGAPELVAIGLVVAPAAVWVGHWRREVLRTRWLILAAALLGSTGSVLVDSLWSSTRATALLAEDGAKFLGIVAWATYFVTTAADITRSTIRAASQVPTTEMSERSA